MSRDVVAGKVTVTDSATGMFFVQAYPGAPPVVCFAENRDRMPEYGDRGSCEIVSTDYSRSGSAQGRAWVPERPRSRW